MSNSAPDLTNIQSHARQIQKDLEAIKTELDQMKMRYTSLDAEADTPANDAADGDTVESEACEIEASPC